MPNYIVTLVDDRVVEVYADTEQHAWETAERAYHEGVRGISLKEES